MANQAWGGRFASETDPRVARFTESISFDYKLFEQDIAGSIAHARMLARVGLITDAECAQIVQGLTEIRAALAAGTFPFDIAREDIHMHIEAALVERLGDVGRKLHTARSRNDQVATDLRLFALDGLRDVQRALCEVQRALLAQARPHVHTLMPGYTHLQRAQPISFAHWCMGYFWQFARDAERMDDCARRIAIMPLGSGALAGNPFRLDRRFLAQALGFPAVTCNALDGVSTRDFVAELLFCWALLGVHLSRLAEDLIVYSSAEFGFVTFDDAYATGSSLMPQKRNPDAMELVRGKAGRLIGDLISVLVVLKGLPTSYNKDLQEDKPPLFDALDTLALALPVVAGAVRSLKVNVARMRAALDPAMLATDVAEYLVRKGVPFRQAHHLTGRAVALAEARGVPLNALPLADWQAISPHFEADVLGVFNFERSLASRDVVGGTSPRAARAQIRQAERWLKKRQCQSDE